MTLDTASRHTPRQAPMLQPLPVMERPLGGGYAELMRVPPPSQLGRAVHDVIDTFLIGGVVEWVGSAARGLDVSACALGADGGPASGDWADIRTGLDLPGTLVIIGDAMGCGERAAASQRLLRLRARRLLRRTRHVPSTMTALDQFVSTFDDTIATCLMVQFDPVSRCVEIHNAGHTPPLIIDQRGTPAYLSAPTRGPLGVGMGCAAPVRALVPAGSTVVLYTDGLVERRGVPIELGLEWLREAARGTHGVSASRLGRRLLTRSLDLGPAEDDMTVVVVSFEGGELDRTPPEVICRAPAR
jgi:serine phosphatase RsbU (regulator of sigma subunit)